MITAQRPHAHGRARTPRTAEVQMSRNPIGQSLRTSLSGDNLKQRICAELRGARIRLFQTSPRRKLDEVPADARALAALGRAAPTYGAYHPRRGIDQLCLIWSVDRGLADGWTLSLQPHLRRVAG